MAFRCSPKVPTIYHRTLYCPLCILIIKKGQLRVYTLSEQGKDITFYRLNDGDISILSASCVIKDITFDYCKPHTCDLNHELGKQNSQRI